jgi:hypothetical protein
VGIHATKSPLKEILYVTSKIGQGLARPGSPGTGIALGRGGGPTRFPAGKLSTQASFSCVSAPGREITRATLRQPLLARLVQPSSLERLVYVPAFAPDGLGDLSNAHPFLAQRYDSRAVESDRAALVNARRFRGVDAGAPAIANEAKSISAAMPSTGRTTRPIGPPVSTAGSDTLRLALFLPIRARR